MTTMVFETEENSRPSTSSASIIQLQEENQNLHEENLFLKKEVEQADDQVHQLTHELTQKQMLMKIYHKELESLDVKKTEKKGSNWKSNFNCLKSKAQVLENEKRELSAELDARKADLENREENLQGLHRSYIKQIGNLKRNLARNEDILKEQGEKNAALLVEKIHLKDKLHEVSREVMKVRQDLEIKDRQMEEYVIREMDILHEIRVREQEINDLKRLSDDRRNEKKLSSLTLNGRSRSRSANESARNMSIKEELEESLRGGIPIPRNNSFGGVLDTVKTANRLCCSLDETDFPDPFSPCRESQAARGLNVERSPTFSVGGDSGWGSDEESSPHFHRFSENHRSKSRKLSSRLQLIKPMEGSETLHQWKELATPSLTKLFEPRDGIVTREELMSEPSAHVKWNTLEQMLSEPEEDDDPEVYLSHDEETRDPRSINQSLAEENTQGRPVIGPPRRVSSQESVFSLTEPMRPRSRSLVETVRQSGIRARQHMRASVKADQQTSDQSSIADKPSLLTSEEFLSSCKLSRSSVSSSQGLDDVVRSFLNRRLQTSRGSLTGESHSEPNRPKTTLHKQLSLDSFASGFGEMVNRAFRTEHEQTILCVPASQREITKNTWKLRLPNDFHTESPTKLKIKIGNKKQMDSTHPLDQVRSGPVGVLHTITNLRKGNLLTGGYGVTTDAHNSTSYGESPYRGDIVLDLF